MSSSSSSSALSTTIFNLENTKPQDNIISAPLAGKKELVQPTPETPVEAAEVQEEEEENSDSEDECEDSEEEEEEEDIDEEQENQLYVDEQSVEVDAPLSAEQEAREALDLAQALGLGSTDEALNKLAGDRRFTSTLDRYGELIGKEEEVSKLYEGFTSNIESLRKATREGIREMMSSTEISTNDDALEAFCIQLEQYLRVLVSRSVLHCDHRESQEVETNDVISSLSLMGRPVPSQLTLLFASNEAEDNEENDADFIPMDEEDDEEDMHENDTSVTEPQEEEAQFWIDSGVFSKLVDLTNRSDSKFTSESYSAVQASVEDFMLLLIRSAADVSRYNGRTAPTAQDIRFAMTMNKMY